MKFDINENFKTLVERGQHVSGHTLDPLLADFVEDVLKDTLHAKAEHWEMPTVYWYTEAAKGDRAHEIMAAKTTGNTILVLLSFLPSYLLNKENKKDYYFKLGKTAYYAVETLARSNSQIHMQACEQYGAIINVLQHGVGSLQTKSPILIS